MSSITADPTCTDSLAEVYISDLFPTLAFGPSYLASDNLMAPASNHHRARFASHPSFLSLLVAAANTYTPPHIDFMGVDSWLQVVSGVKLWVVAPPQSAAAFSALFDTSVSTANFRAEEWKVFNDIGGIAYLQSAGDVIVIPGGWPHFVYNLTPTVAFGGSHLRVESLPVMLRFLTDKGYTLKTQQSNIVGMGMQGVIAAVIATYAGADRERVVRLAARIAAAMTKIMNADTRAI